MNQPIESVMQRAGAGRYEARKCFDWLTWQVGKLPSRQAALKIYRDAPFNGKPMDLDNIRSLGVTKVDVYLRTRASGIG